MARKRSFGELIDLTQEISDDDLPPQAQKARLSESFTVKATSDSTTEHPTVRPSSPNTVFEDDLRKKLLQNLGRVENKADRSSPTATDQYTPSQYDLMNFESIISQMNEKVDALRRSRYEPKTIARDILIAAGKHPSMIPLNYHLDNLRKKFRYVDYKSDLSTFRWDLVDPGGPKPGASDEKQGHTINQPIKAQQHSWKSQPPNSQGQTESNQVQEGLDPSQNDFVEENLMSFFHDDPDPVATPDQPHKKRRGRPSGSGRKPINGITGKSNAVVKTPEQKRRGRPVGSRNRTSDVSRSKMVTQRRSLPSGSIPMRSSGLKNAETPSEGFAVLIGSGTEM